MDVSTVPAPSDGAGRPIIIPAQFFPLLEAAGTWLVGARGEEVHTGVDDGAAPRHVADMLIANLAEAITARAEIVAAADQPEGAVSVATLRIVGPNAVGDERYRLTEAWTEGGEDTRGLAERTKHLADLEDLLVLAEATVTT